MVDFHLGQSERSETISNVLLRSLQNLRYLARRNDKNVDYQASYRGFENYAYTAFPHPQVWYHPGYVQPPPHPTTAAPINGHYGSNGEMGEYIGGTWYPKQPSDSGIDDSPSKWLFWYFYKVQ